MNKEEKEYKSAVLQLQTALNFHNSNSLGEYNVNWKSVELILEYIKNLQKKAELGEHYKHLYSEVKKQKDDVVELIIKLYQKEYNKTSDWWLQEELCNNFDDMNIFTNFELERMLGEIDE